MSQFSHEFGGDWTAAKLSVLQKYLKAYTTALKGKPQTGTPFKKAYIDAFAGTGYYHPQWRDTQNEGGDFLDLLAQEEPQSFLKGSAKLALEISPPFDSYIFVEKDRARCLQLEALRHEHPDKAAAIVIQQSEANSAIKDICRKDWRSHRAVLFLDPYGMDVEWATLEAIARTKAIDLWLLFPSWMAVNRLLTRTGDIADGWRRRLTVMFGTDNWYEAFYEHRTEQDLFGERTELVKRSAETIIEFFVARLKTIFAGVADKPGILRNSAKRPLYHLCFAVANKRGAPTAMAIAKDLLRDLN